MIGEPLRIEHKDFIVSKLRGMRLPYCEFSFADVWLNRKVYRSRLVQYHDIWGIHTENDLRVFIPLDPIPQHLAAYKKMLREENGLSLFPLSVEWAELFSDGKFQLYSNEGWTDYLYLTEKIAEYAGRALDGKRNQVRHFLDRYSYEIVPFSRETIPDALELLHHWKRSHPSNDDTSACQEGIETFEDVGLEGILLMVEGKAVGFMLGQPLNEQVYDVSFAKADISYDGVYSFLFQSMAKTIQEEFINYESDWGVPGLRKSKIEYSPDHFAIKWRVEPK